MLLNRKKYTYQKTKKYLLIIPLLVCHVSGYTITYTMSALNTVLHPNGTAFVIDTNNAFVLPSGATLVVDNFDINVNVTGANRYLIEMQGNNTIEIKAGRTITAGTIAGQEAVQLRVLNPTGQGSSVINIANTASLRAMGRNEYLAHVVSTKSNGDAIKENITFNVNGRLTGYTRFNQFTSTNNKINILNAGVYELSLNTDDSISVSNSSLNIGGVQDTAGQVTLSAATFTLSDVSTVTHRNYLYPVGNIRVFAGSTFNLQAVNSHATDLKHKTVTIDTGAAFNMQVALNATEALRTQQLINQGAITIVGPVNDNTKRIMNVEETYNKGNITLTGYAELNGFDNTTSVLTNDSGANLLLGTNTRFTTLKDFYNKGSALVEGTMQNVVNITNEGTFTIGDGSTYHTITKILNKENATFNLEAATSINNQNLILDNSGLLDFKAGIYYGDEIVNKSTLRLRGATIDTVTLHNLASGIVNAESGIIRSDDAKIIDNKGVFNLIGATINDTDITFVNYGTLNHNATTMVVANLLMHKGSSYNLTGTGILNTNNDVTNNGNIVVNSLTASISDNIVNNKSVIFTAIDTFANITNNETLEIHDVANVGGGITNNKNCLITSAGMNLTSNLITNNAGAILQFKPAAGIDLSNDRLVNNGTVILSGNVTSTANYTGSNTSSLNVTKNVAVSFDGFVHSGEINFDISSATDFGKITFTHATSNNNLTNTTLKFNIDKDLTGAHAFDVIDSVPLLTGMPNAYNNVDSYLYKNRVVATNYKIIFDYNRQALNSISGMSDNASSLAAALEQLYISSSDEKVTQFMDALLINTKNKQDLENTLLRSAPNTTHVLQNLAVQRTMDALLVNRMNNKLLAYNSGSYYDDRFAVWIKYFAGINSQQQGIVIPNYSYNASGFVGGLEFNDYAGHITGVAFTSANSYLNKYLNFTNNSKVDSYKALIYGAPIIAKNINMNWDLGVNINRVSQIREHISGNVSVAANSKYSSHYYFAKAGMGYILEATPTDTLVPRISLQYMRVQNYKFEESDAGGLSLISSYPNKNVLNLNVGMHWLGNYYINDYKFKPQIGIAYILSILDTNYKIKSKFKDQDLEFTTLIKQPRGTAQLNAAMQFDITSNLQFDFDVSLEIYEKYKGFMAALKTKYTF